MKLIAILIIFLGLLANANVYSQKITLSERNAPLKKVFQKIESQTGYNFIYREEWIDKSMRINIRVVNATLDQVLDLCFQETPLTYSLVGNTVVIKLKPGANGIEEDLQETSDKFSITGLVTNKFGDPVPSVSVVIPGTVTGSMTNDNGEYYINDIPPDAQLLFSIIGYKPQLVNINGRSSINIVLEIDIIKMDETVVIGYGTTTKRMTTSSISSITSEEISRQPVANPLNALQGRIAGALVTQANGLPGSRVTIQIRGYNSIDPTGAGMQPLYIIDGVPFNIYDNTVPKFNDLNATGQFAAAGGLSPFSVINPNDIERIDVLKDADATAIYGTRGANGVVLITTKKGKPGKTRLDINLYQGRGTVGHFIPMMNTREYLQMRTEAFANDGITPTTTNAPDLLLWDQDAHTDWQQKYLGGTAGITDAQATLSGGDLRTRFLFNTGYHIETPVYPGEFNASRISTRLSIDHNSLDRKFNANLSVNYSFDNTNLLNQDLSTLYNIPPNMPIYNSDGSLFWNANFINPESHLLVKYIGKTHNLMTSTIMRYTILPGLDVKTSFGFNSIQLEQNTQNPALSKNPLTGQPTNSASFADIDQRSYILEPQLTYTKVFPSGRLSTLLGSTFQHSLNTATSLSGDHYSSSTLLNSISGAGSFGTPRFNYTLYRFNSIFTRVGYELKSKYLFNAVLRRDGSSRFGPGKRFGTFWSLGAGWIFSEESFTKSLEFLSFAKFRSSYGVTGNDQIPDYLYRTFFSSSGTYQNGPALLPNRVSNPLLHWQTTYKLEFGLDLAFLDRKIELTVNHYRNRTPDQLGFLSLSSQAGFNSISSNFEALIQNTGWELELHTSNIDKKDLKWRSSFNITIPRTKLISASPEYFFYRQSLLGKPLGINFRYAYMGVDPATGKPLYQSIANDTLTFTPNFGRDRLPVGYTAPKLYGGLNNVLNYKNFELAFFIQFTRQHGNILPNSIPGELLSGNQTTFWLDRWKKPGDMGIVPGYTTSTSVYSSWGLSDAIWGDASFIKLRTVNLSYFFSEAVVKKLKVDNVKFYLQGQNLWWISKDKFVYDPETGIVMPPLRVITAGINVTL